MGEINVIEGLSYDDVLIRPKRSPLSSRKDADTTTYITKDIKLSIPLISANMDTVTETDLAIELAQLGGLGILHRFLPIEEEANMVRKVKRARNKIIEDPYTIDENATLEQIYEKIEDCGVKTLIVTSDKKLKGIITSRDLRLLIKNGKLAKDIMTKRENLIVGNEKTTFEQATEIFREKKIEKLPLVNSSDELIGLITYKDAFRKVTHPNAALDKKGRLLVGAAIGVVGDFIDRARALVEAEVDILLLDIAHLHSENGLNALKRVKKEFPNVPVMAGNIATKEAAIDLVKHGADSIKVGIGPGSACSTRIVTGCGVPQISAIIDSVKGSSGVPVIADGGLKNSADIVKALCAGANAIMSGTFFSGTKESPGIVRYSQGRRFKIYRGSASFDVNVKNQALNKRVKKIKKAMDLIVPEGVEGIVPYKGPLATVVNQLIGGVKSGMSYCGAKTIPEMQKDVTFIKITNAGMRESAPHDLKIMHQ